MTSVRSIKLCYLDEIRRLPVASLKAMTASAPASTSTLEALKKVVVQTYPSLEGREFTLKYSDEDKDLITIATDGAFVISPRLRYPIPRSLLLFLTSSAFLRRPPTTPKPQRSSTRPSPWRISSP